MNKHKKSFFIPLLLFFNNFITKCQSEYEIDELFICPDDETLKLEEKNATDVFNKYLNDLEPIEIELWRAYWDNSVNSTEDSIYRQDEADNKKELLKERILADVRTQFKHWKSYADSTLKLHFEYFLEPEIESLPVDNLWEIISQMQNIYTNAKMCEVSPSGEKNCKKNKDFFRIMETSSDWTTLEQAWKTWRDISGKKMLDLFEQNVILLNKAATSSGFKDAGDQWRSNFKSETLEEDLEKLWHEFVPLYRELHTFVGNKIKTKFPNNTFPESGLLPAHIMGDMFAHQWTTLDNLVMPFPSAKSINVSKELLEKNYTVQTMVEIGEQFFISLGFDKLPKVFWNESIFENNPDLNMICQGSAWDMQQKDDFRILGCFEVSAKYFFIVQHELGHIYYYMSYRHLPLDFRRAPNDGLNEAIGDTIFLSASTPVHLKTIGLIDDFESNEENDLNQLMSQALTKIVFIPFGYLLDKWRWDVFSGKIDRANYNNKYWEARCKYQGVYPPVERTSEDFDPGSKFHVPWNVPYISYFVSSVLQFQFHEALCKEAKSTKPLHQCTIYNSKAAGDKLR